MYRPGFAVMLVLLLASCGGNSRQPGFQEDGLPGLDALDTRDVDSAQVADTKDGVEAKDLADSKDLDGAILMDVLDTRDLVDGLDVDAFVSACKPPCSQYQLCQEETGQCQDNDLCKTDFCTETPAGAEKLQFGETLTYMDRYEWPNTEGVIPQGGIATAGEAGGMCLSVGKRLCKGAELAAACSTGSKYPYDDIYDGTKCNTEFPFEPAKAGAFPDCHAEGVQVFDLVGNLAEWTAEGQVFGGSVEEGTEASCQYLVTPNQPASFALYGFRCCLSPTDDLDNDGTQASLDCDDLDKDIHPGAPELCDGLDNDCDGQVDNAEDNDNDGFNACLDCNDKSASYHPGAEDKVGDGYDLNCDGIDGEDKDGDKVASKESGGTDCEDGNAFVYPGAPELCDGLDNDCEGSVDVNLAEGACDDGNVCTDDSCDKPNKKCKHEPITCDDSNDCTDNTCDPQVGCAFPANNAACSDKNPCTENDQCVSGVCLGMPKACTDDNACTIGDYCEEGTGLCKAGPDAPVCNDNNDCTTDTCDPGTGCKYTPRQGSCDDKDACTPTDSCINGVCTPGTNTCQCTKTDDCWVREDGNYCNGMLYCNTAKTPAICEVDTKTIPKPCLADQDTFCSANTCKPAVGMCFQTPRNEGLACEKACTIEPVCKDGTCQGTSCAVAGMACAGGVCILKTCTAGKMICDGDSAYMVCNETGNGWSSSTPCQAGQYCDSGECKAKVCTPGAPSCLGRLAGTCNALGSGLFPGYTNCEDIPATPFCQDGQCTACTPNCASKQCGDDGCGGKCGECGAGKYCDKNGACYFDIEALGNKWIPIPAGAFMMGNSKLSAESPVHQVTLSAFEMLETEVTEGQYLAVVGNNPSCHFNGAAGSTMPVECVTWEEAKAFCMAVGSRLPTEAEWEYSARAGTTASYYCGETVSCLKNYAWYRDNSWSHKHETRQKKVNAFGLYDTLGNVQEWTADWNGPYAEAQQIDPVGPVNGDERVRRGGGFLSWENNTTVSVRPSSVPSKSFDNLGFRCVKSVD